MNEIERFPLPSESDPNLNDTPWTGPFRRNMIIGAVATVVLAVLCCFAAWGVGYARSDVEICAKATKSFKENQDGF